MRLNTFVLYLDENLCNCQEIIRVLESAKVKFKRHLEIFPTSTKDPVFLPYIGKKGWTLLTCDEDIRRRRLEQQAVLAHRVRMFAFTSSNLNGIKMATILQRGLRAMRNLVKKTPPPFIASLTENGSVYIRFDSSGTVRRKLSQK